MVQFIENYLQSFKYIKEKTIMSSDDYFIRIANKKDYRDVIKLGYPFDVNILFLDGITIRKLLYGKKIVCLAAYSPKIKKSMAFVKLQEINSNIWGIWGTFVSSDFRRKGIASKLYNEAFTYLKNNDVKKCIGVVSYQNMPSLENLKKTWDGFLDRIIYLININKKIEPYKNVEFNDLKEIDVEQVYQIYKKNLGESWINYLELNKNNFLGRIFGSACCESYNSSILRKVFIPIKSNIIKINGKLVGHCTYSDILFNIQILFNPSYRLKKHIFLGDIKKLPLILNNDYRDDIYYIGKEENHKFLTDNYKIIDKLYICYKNLCE